MTHDKEAAESAVLSIGQAAEATGLSVKTIRYYEEAGLIPKAPRHNGAARTGGNRLYTGAAIGRLRFVHSARMLGMTLEDIRRLLAIAEQGCPSDRPDYRGLFTRHLRDVDARITRLAELRGQIERLLSQKRFARSMPCCWASCNCLGANDATTRGATSKRRPRRDPSKGESHV